MFSRVVFVVIAAFWLGMNVLLFRKEFGSGTAGTTPVPLELVWGRVLTSPDSSSLTIMHHGTKIGFCHWITDVGEEWANVSDENIPHNLPRPARVHRLRLEGSAVVPELKNRIRFEGSLKVNDHHSWEELNSRVNIHPFTWEIHSVADEQVLKLTVESGKARVEHVFKFSDLRDPGVFLNDVFGPAFGDMFDQAGIPPALGDSLPAGLVWEASEDTLRIGKHQVTVYRLQTRILDRYQVSILISRVGELLRIELPDDLVLVNDHLVTL